MKVLVTGASGFAGRHFVEYLSGVRGVEVHGLVRSATQPAAGLKARFHACDLLKSGQVLAVIRRVRPDRIFHLAAQSSVPVSWKEPGATFDVNVLGTLHLLEAVRKLNIDPLIHIAGSSEEYGKGSGRPLRETDGTAPLNPYGASKDAQSRLAGYYASFAGLRIIRTRGFSHTGPEQNDLFAVSSFAKQVARIEKKKQEPVISVGNLGAVRDYTDVRDVVRAYWLALEKGKSGQIYNVCSGTGRRMSDVLDALVRSSRVKITVKKEEDRLRPADTAKIVGDGSKFRKATGWKPQITLEKTLLDLLEGWRRKI